jgi:hypothetical protein
MTDIHRSSFKGSFCDLLIREACELEPDYSSRFKLVHGDQPCLKANPMIGKYLALKRKYLELANATSDDDYKQHCMLIQSVAHHLAEYELKSQIRTQPRRRHMHLRNTGVIVYAPPPSVAHAA